MNKKAQNNGPVAFMIMVGMFVLCWFTFLGEWINTTLGLSLGTGYFSGLEEFLLSNWQVWIFVACILGVMGFMYFRA